MSTQIRDTAAGPRPINMVIPSSRTMGNPIVSLQAGAGQVRSYSTVSVQTAVIDADMVRLVATSNCFVLSGADPTVSATNGVYLPLGRVLYLPITPGHVIAAIRATADGTLYITPCTR